MSRLLDYLDRQRFAVMLLCGSLLGLALGFLVIGRGPWGLVGAVAVGLAAGALAWTSQPVDVWEDELQDLLEMVSITGGTFLMGSPEDEPGRGGNERQHEVTVSPFLMGRTPVTRKEYGETMGLEEAPGGGEDEHPVTMVTWLDAVKFCNRLSEEAGLKPSYRIWWDKVWWIRDSGYRLPTEAEWEYAARAGTEGRWSFGDDQSQLGDYAWFSGNSAEKAHPVGTRKPNPWGLYDMHGNVWEWCWDAFDEYRQAPSTDPRGPAGGARALRVLRGGSFGNEPRFLRSAIRNRDVPGYRFVFLGFRCVRRPRLLQP